MLLRDLAKEVRDIAREPSQGVLRALWKRHNRLERVRPLVLVFPEGAWREILPYSRMRMQDGFWTEVEWELRHRIYRWNSLRDDNVIEASYRVPAVYRNTGWGLDSRILPSPDETGAYRIEPAIREYDDIGRMEKPRIIFDWDRSARGVECIGEAIGDILSVSLDRLPKSVDMDYIKYATCIDTSLAGTLARLRGIEPLMYDMYENPSWIHRVMSFLTEATELLLDELEEERVLRLNNGGDYVGSGGVGWTDELPAEGFDPLRVRTRDMWGAAEAQDFTMVSPEMFGEFILPYQKRLLARFGLACYGCCENLDRKLEMIKTIPRLRRISVSPFTPIAGAAEALGGDFIFSWKPNPSEMMVTFDEERIRRTIRDALDATRNCVPEIILKDTHTVMGDPRRMTRWLEICREEIARSEG